MLIFNKKYIKESLKYLLRSSFFINKYVKEIDALYEMTPMELKKRNEKRFLEIFNKAFTSSAYYRNLCKSVGVTSIDDIKHIEDIVKLPILTKDMLKEYGKELLTCKEKGLIKNHTSGTTGTPLTVYQNWESVWREQAYFVCYRKRCGYNYGKPMVSLRGNLTRDEISLKIHVSNTLFLSSYNINSKTAETYHRLIEKHHPKAIEGYPSSLYSLALVLKDKGLECHIPVAFTSSETLFDYQRKLIEEVFHTQVFDHYGTTERTIRLEESLDHNGYFEDPGYGIEEYYDDHIISTSLINDVFPLIRYKTDDRIILKEGVEKTPEGFIDYSHGIEKVEGRAMTFIIGKDGTKYSDAALTFIFKDTSGVRYSQFVQKEQGNVDLKIVSDESYSDEVEKHILYNINKKIGIDNINVTIHYVKEQDLIYTKRNKLMLVVNEMSTANVLWGGVIQRIVGRTDDILFCKDGSMVTRVDFIEEGEHIKACQWIQNEKGKLEIRIAPDEGFSNKDVDFVVEETLKRCGHGNMDITTKVCSMDEMIYSKRGKFKLIVNNLQTK